MYTKLALFVLFPLLQLVKGNVLMDRVNNLSDQILAKQINQLISSANCSSIGFYKIAINFKSKDMSEEILNNLHPETLIMTEYFLMNDHHYESKLDIILYFLLNVVRCDVKIIIETSCKMILY